MSLCKTEKDMEDNIKMVLSETGCEDWTRVELAQDRVECGFGISGVGSVRFRIHVFCFVTTVPWAVLILKPKVH